MDVFKDIRGSRILSWVFKSINTWNWATSPGGLKLDFEAKPIVLEIIDESRFCINRDKSSARIYYYRTLRHLVLVASCVVSHPTELTP